MVIYCEGRISRRKHLSLRVIVESTAIYGPVIVGAFFLFSFHFTVYLHSLFC